MPGFLAGDGSTCRCGAPSIDSATPPTAGISDATSDPRQRSSTASSSASTNSTRSTARSMSSGGASAHLRSRTGPGCAAHGPTGDHDGQPVPDRDTRRLQRSLPYRALRHLHAPHLEMRVPAYVRDDLPVPTTSIYTAPTVSCAGLTAQSRHRDERERRGLRSHCGLGFNLAALIVVADRLAQPLDRWQPFQVHRSLRRPLPGRTDLPGSCRTRQRLRRRPDHLACHPVVLDSR